MRGCLRASRTGSRSGASSRFAIRGSRFARRWRRTTMVTTAKGATADPSPPSDAEMAAVLGDAYPAFRTLLSRGGKGAAEWRQYNKQSPWVLKVSERKRTLFYARPDSGSLKVTVLLGGRAVEAGLAGQVSKRLHASIRNAKVYPSCEGRGVDRRQARGNREIAPNEILTGYPRRILRELSLCEPGTGCRRTGIGPRNHRSACGFCSMSVFPVH